MALWEEFLQEAELGGVVLPVVRRRLRQRRAYGRKELPYVSGQETESTGRGPRIFEVQIELFADVDPEHYPDRYEELVAVLNDDVAGGKTTWVDPVWGPVQVAITEMDIDEDSQARDGATISLVLEEDGFSDLAQESESWLFVPSDRATAEADAAELDAAREDAGISDDDLDTAWGDAGFAREPGETLSFADGVTDMLAAIDEGAQRADEVTGKVDRVRARAEALMEMSEAQTASAWPVLERGARLIETTRRIGEAVLARSGTLQPYTTSGWRSVFEIAVELYGSVDRADEVMRRNPLQHPLFIPPGTVLSVLDR